MHQGHEIARYQQDRRKAPRHKGGGRTQDARSQGKQFAVAGHEKDQDRRPYLRNSRGATSVASYSLRARSGASVATPLRWSELGGLGSSRQFDMRTVLTRLDRLRSDPREGIDTLQQDLRDVVERLDGKTRHRSG